jgi:plasmid replication initiation protein
MAVIRYPVEDLYKHNDYIKMVQIKKQMSLQQQRVFDTVLASIQEMKKVGLIEEVISEGELVLDFHIFREQMLKGSKIKKINRSELQKAMETMVDIKFSYKTDDEVGAFVIFQKARINFEDNKVYLTFGKDFRTENLLPTANYTALSLTYLNSFSSQYARLLYQYFKMLIGKDISNPFRVDITLEIDFLHKLLGINSKEHENYINNNSLFISRVITPAITQIKNTTDIEATINPIKRGRKITHIQFLFPPKEEFTGAKKEPLEDHGASHESVLFIPSFTAFKQFREWLLQYMIGKPLVKGPKGYFSDVIISLSSKGYLHNNSGNIDLTPDDAMEMWTWLFENQERIGQLELSEREVQCFNLKNKSFLAENGETKMEEKVTIKEICFNESDDTLVDVKLQKKDGEIIEVKGFFLFEQLRKAREVE